MSAGEFRLRVRHLKAGRLRYLSHLELSRAVERSARRAGLPYAVTHGFSPKMKIAFGPALPVGTAGLRECYDVWLRSHVPAVEAFERLLRATPEGLEPVEAGYVHPGEPSLSAALVLARYEVAVGDTPAGKEVVPEELEAALCEVVAARTLSVSHKGRTKAFDLSRALPKGPRVGSRESGTIVEIDALMGPEGSLRPESLTGAALSRLGLVDAVVKVTRTDILNGEEVGQGSRPR